MKTPSRLDLAQARLNLRRLLAETPSSPADFERQVAAIPPAAGRVLVLDAIKDVDPNGPQANILVYLASEFNLAAEPDPLLQLLADRTQPLGARQLGLMIMAGGNPEALDRAKLQLEPALTDVLSAKALEMLLDQVLVDSAAPREMSRLLLEMPAEGRDDFLCHLDAERLCQMIPAWVIYEPVLASAELESQHELIVAALSDDFLATGVDVWDDVLALDLAEATRLRVLEAVMRTRTARLNGAGARALSSQPVASAWLTACDGVGAYVILVRIQLPNGQFNIYNVCLHTTAELRDGFILTDRTDDEWQGMLDMFFYDYEQDFVRVPLVRACEMVAEARTSPLNRWDDIDDAGRVAVCMQWAAGIASEDPEEDVETLACVPPVSGPAFSAEELDAVLANDDYERWFLNEQDLAELNVSASAPAYMENQWLNEQLVKINTPEVRDHLRLLFEHMAGRNQWEGELELATECATVAGMIADGGQSAALVMKNYLLRSFAATGSAGGAFDQVSTSREADNMIFLERFAESMRSNGLSKATVKKHTDNVDFYLNDFLLYYSDQSAGEGIAEVGEFLGDWFIRKAMWSTPATVRSNASSLKKFYQFMHDEDIVTLDELAEMKREIKADLPDWVAAVTRYNDPEYDDAQ